MSKITNLGGVIMTKKIYWENPYLYEIDALVEEKKIKDNKFYVKLNRTIFYPNMSGGQPGDKGTIDGVKVLDTYEEGNKIIHVLEKNISQLKVKLKIDSTVRFDLMQQHTGQHLLSGVFYNLYNAETVGFHLGEEYVTIDITLDEISIDEIRKVEQMCNKIIQSNFKVKSYFVTNDNVHLIPVRKPPTVNEDIRIIEIEGFDYSPCGGTHVSYTGEIGLIKIRKWEKYKGNIRIEFLCGNRAINDYTWKSDYIKTMANMLSSKDTDVLSKFEKIYQEKISLEKEIVSIKNDLMLFRSSILLSNGYSINNFNIIRENFINESFKDIGLLNSYICNNNSNLVTIFTLTSDKGNQFIISKSRDLEIDLLKLYKDLSSKISVKGGGNNNTIQGNVPPENLSELIDFVNYWLSTS